MNRPPCVYFAANTAAASEVAALSEEFCNRIQFTQRWPWVFLSSQFQEDSPDHMRWAWCNNSPDISRADYLLLLTPEDPKVPMRGALVEVGMAIASHVHVVIAGEHPGLGSWQHHPSVLFRTLEVRDALEFIISKGAM